MPETAAGVGDFVSTLFAAAPAAGAADAGAVTAAEAAAGDVATTAAAGGAAGAGGVTAGDIAASLPALASTGGALAGGAPGAATGVPTIAGAPVSSGEAGSAAASAPKPAGAAPGASGGGVGGSTSPSIANSAPGADIGGTSSTGNTFDLQSANTGPYQTPDTNNLTFGGPNPGNLTTQTNGGGFLDSIFGPSGASSSSPMGTSLNGIGSSTSAWGGDAAGAGGAVPSKGIGGAIADSLGVTSPIGKDLISALPAALPLAYTAIKGEQLPKGSNALTSESQQLQSQGAAMSAYLANGTLPPGIQTALDSAKSSAIAAIKSSYAARGESGSSAEATDIANAEAQIVGQGSQIAMNLYQQGVSEEQVAAQIQSGLLTNTIQQDAQFSTALGNFTAALAGGGSPLGNIKLSVG